MSSGNGTGDLGATEAQLRAVAEAQIQDQLAQMRAGTAPAPVPPVPAVAAPAGGDDFEALAYARFLEWTSNDGRSVFIDPAAVVAVEAHPSAPVCKLYQATGAVVTVHGTARDVASRLQLAAQARRDLEHHLDEERMRALALALAAALRPDTTPTPTP